MGHKVSPVGLRTGITKDWVSRWFAPKLNYANLVLEDMKIRKLLDRKLESAGLKEVQIERTENEINILIQVSKPGVVIGKGGTGVEELEKEIRKITKAKIRITAEEVKVPELEAKLVADHIARQIKRRVPYRRVVNFAANSAMNKGAKGIKVRMSGVLSGSNTIARTEQYVFGSVPTQTIRATVDYAQLDCHLLFGTIGIKVWIFK
jgi:small subunit ribosomal protein S3